MDYLNQSDLSQQVIKENIDKNVIEELLSSLVSSTLLNLEIKDLNLILSKETIVENLKINTIIFRLTNLKYLLLQYYCKVRYHQFL